MSKQWNLGIMGCAAIIERAIINPLKDMEDIMVYGIASRHNDKALAYSKTYHIPHVFDDYNALLNCADIDGVYIALPNAIHFEWVMRAIEKGKHVLVEKPMCLHEDEILSIKKMMIAYDVHVLEGVMVQHHPWQQAIKDMVDKKILGELQEIHTDICIISKGDLTKSYRGEPLLGGGVWYDLSCYWLQFLQHILGLEGIAYEGRITSYGVNQCDMTMNSRIRYPEGVQCSCVCSFELPYRTSHILTFSHGRIVLKDFFRACVGYYKIKARVYEDRDKSQEVLSFDKQNYYTNQLRFFRDVMAGKVDNISIEATHERIKIMERIYEDARSIMNDEDVLIKG